MFVKGNLREYTRTYFVKQIRFFVNSHGKAEDNFDNETAVSVDISRGGIGIFTTYPLKEGQHLTFEDEIRNHRIKATSAVVRWSGKINGSRYRVGLQFADYQSGHTA
jgi:c-di-GMP-binding flagellar brake protein YcgR